MNEVAWLHYGLDDRTSVPVRGRDSFLFATGYGAQPASYPMGTGRSFLGVKRTGREADCLLASSAEVKNVWSYTSTLTYVFMVWCLVKHRDKFIFTFIFIFSYIRTHVFQYTNPEKQSADQDWEARIFCLTVSSVKT